MSDRPARPEWRAAYLNRTLTQLARRPYRTTVAGSAAATARSAEEPSGVNLGPRRAPARRRSGAAGSSLLSMAAMLRAVPTA